MYYICDKSLPRQMALNKHALKDYLATARWHNKKARAVEFIQQAFENCREFTRDSPKDKG